MKYLFHYTSFNTLKHILNNNTLLFNNINKVNDPYESKSFDFADIEREKIKIWSSKDENFYRMEWSEEDELIIKNLENEISYIDEEFDDNEEANYKKIINDYYDYYDDDAIINNNDNDEYDDYEQLAYNNYLKKNYNSLKNRLVKTSCFCNGVFSNIHDYTKSIPKKRPGFFYPRMWAQYGENSKGCCIIFNKKKLKKIFTNLSIDHYIFDRAIKYIDILTNEHIINIKEAIFNIPSNLNKNAIIDHLRKNVYLFYFRKDINWRDEKEYRFLIINKVNNDNDDIENMNIENTIDYIVLGENNKYKLEMVKNKCYDNKIILYKLKNNLGDYYLKKM